MTVASTKWEYLPKRYKHDGVILGWRMEAHKGNRIVALCNHMHATPDEANECPNVLAAAEQL